MAWWHAFLRSGAPRGRHARPRRAGRAAQLPAYARPPAPGPLGAPHVLPAPLVPQQPVTEALGVRAGEAPGSQPATSVLPTWSAAAPVPGWQAPITLPGELPVQREDREDREDETPRVELWFDDGSVARVDPQSPSGRALRGLADELTAPR